MTEQHDRIIYDFLNYNKREKVKQFSKTLNFKCRS